jgi:hypothetical protein
MGWQTINKKTFLLLVLEFLKITIEKKGKE